MEAGERQHFVQGQREGGSQSRAALSQLFDVHQVLFLSFLPPSCFVAANCHGSTSWLPGLLQAEDI